jgi:N-terminal half of MaoC dehydratase
VPGLRVEGSAQSTLKKAPTFSILGNIQALFDLDRSVPFHESRDPVNLPMQRRWCDAMGVTNPVFLDKSVAERSSFGRIISPLAMLDVWSKPGLQYHRNVEDPIGSAFETLEADGFTSAVVVGSELSQIRSLVLDEHVRSTVMLESVSDEKSTALGAARFVTSRQDFLVGDEPVGQSRLVVMKFRPTADQRRASQPPVAETATGTNPIRVASRDDLGTVLASAMFVGDKTPVVAIPITPTLIVAGALMSSDYYEPHHDRDIAQQRGSRDIFMNIHTTFGLVQRCIGDWLGPNARWHVLRARLGVPNYPGETMLVSGTVTAVDSASSRTTIEFRATNGLGSHATGSVEVTLPP